MVVINTAVTKASELITVCNFHPEADFISLLKHFRDKLECLSLASQMFDGKAGNYPS
jgi:hypothetical protein